MSLACHCARARPAVNVQTAVVVGLLLRVIGFLFAAFVGWSSEWLRRESARGLVGALI